MSDQTHLKPSDPGACERCRVLTERPRLTPEEARWLGRHLALCDGCADVEGVAETLLATELADTLPVSRDLHTRLLQIPTRERRLRFLAPLALPLAALTCAVGAGLIWLLLNGPLGPPQELARATTPTAAVKSTTGRSTAAPRTAAAPEIEAGANSTTRPHATGGPTDRPAVATQIARAEGSPASTSVRGQTPAGAPGNRRDRPTSGPEPTDTSLTGTPGAGDDAPPTATPGASGTPPATPTSADRGLMPSATPTDAPEDPPTNAPPAPPGATETPGPRVTPPPGTSPPATPPLATPTALATQPPPRTPGPQTPGTPARPPASPTPIPARSTATITATASVTPTLTATPTPGVASARSTRTPSAPDEALITGPARLRWAATRPYRWRPMSLQPT